MADYARKRSGSADNGGDNCASITYKCGWETKGITITFDPTGHIHTFNDIYNTRSEIVAISTLAAQVTFGMLLLLLFSIFSDPLNIINCF